MGEILQPELRRIGAKYPRHIGAVHGKGLVAALHMIQPGGIEPNKPLAWDIIKRCVEKGLLFFAPVGYGGASVKIAPPLTVTEEPLREGISVLEEVLAEVLR
jgi:4-aminobutyrate aminotransferase-like enzyme